MNNNEGIKNHDAEQNVIRAASALTNEITRGQVLSNSRDSWRILYRHRNNE
jgi:hypothetical protein